MKNILIISLFFPLFNCGVKKDLATAQQENIELEKRLTELEKKQDELKKQNQELINQNQEYKDQMSILIRKKEKNNQAVVEDRPPLPIIKKKFPVTEDPASFPGGEEKFFKFILF